MPTFVGRSSDRPGAKHADPTTGFEAKDSTSSPPQIKTWRGAFGTFDLLGHHHLDKLLVVDLTVAVDVGLPDHLVDLLVGELLPKVGHDVTELGGGDEAVAVLVEDLEGLEDLLLGVSILHFAGHHGEELGEVDGAVAVGVDLVDHVHELGLGGVLAEGSHDGAKLLGGDGAW